MSKILWLPLTSTYVLKIGFKIQIVDHRNISTICCAITLLLLQLLCVSHLTTLLLTSNFRPKFHFWLEIPWLVVNSFKIRGFLVRDTFSDFLCTEICPSGAYNHVSFKFNQISFLSMNMQISMKPVFLMKCTILTRKFPVLHKLACFLDESKILVGMDITFCPLNVSFYYAIVLINHKQISYDDEALIYKRFLYNSIN